MAGIPIGAIIYWSGSLGAVPTGFQLCDGSNGTPDLRDRFVYGAGGMEAPLVVGGSATVDLPAHLHAAATSKNESTSASFPYQQAHWHESSDGPRATDADGATALVTEAGTLLTTIESGAAHSHPFYVATDTSDLFYLANQPAGVNHHHTGSGSYASAGPLADGNQLPFFYALYYVQRLF